MIKITGTLLMDTQLERIFRVAPGSVHGAEHPDAL